MNAAPTHPIRGLVAFAMVVGPGEAEMAIDTMEGIRTFYPNAAIWIREDRTCDGTWETLSAWSECQPVNLSRNATSQGYFGFAKSVYELFQAILQSGETPEMIVKIDPDGLLVKPGLVEVFRQRFDQTGPGMCGSYKIGPDGTRRKTHMHAKTIIYDLMPVGKSNDRTFRTRPVFYIKFLLRALLHGYFPGEHVLGGIYALDGRTLIELERVGFLGSVPSRHKSCNHCEDVLLSMATKSVGHKLISLNEYPDDVVAWLKAIRPLGISPEEVWTRNYLAIHPVKKMDVEIRQFFKEKRLAGQAN